MRTTSASKRSITPAIRKADVPSPNMLFRQQGATRLGFSPTAIPRGSRRGGSMGKENFGGPWIGWGKHIKSEHVNKKPNQGGHESITNKGPRPIPAILNHTPAPPAVT